MVAAAIVGAGVASAGASIIGSSNAASAQESAANKANATEMAMYQQTRSDLRPYNRAGQRSMNALQQQLPSLTAPINMSESMLEQTPGYQFNLQQGLKATQSGYAARGLGASGAALKGAGAYATGLADNTYQQQFANALANKQNTYNMLMGVAQTGESAGAQTGAYGTQIAGQVGQNTIGAGNAAAAADMNMGASVGNALNSIPNALLTQGMLNGMAKQGMYQPV